MKLRESHKLADELRKQGATVVRKRSGYLVQTKLGSMVWHLTPGDVRADRNIRAQLERIGLTWPTL